jgi:hypothetical protein
VTELSQRVKNAFDEARLLLLVIQVFIGFQFRAPFEPLYTHLTGAARGLEAVGLVLLLTALLMLVAPAPFSTIAYPGENSSAVESFTSVMVGASLLPFAGALAVNLFVAASTFEPPYIAALLSVVFFGAATGSWYVWPWRHRVSGHSPRTASRQAALDERIEHVLTEARMIVPGASTLLGFQFATVLMEAFDRLPLALKELHLVSLSLVAVAIIVLIAPAAYHRLAEKGGESERVVRFATKCILVALVPLGVGIALETFIVMRAADSPRAWTIVVPALTLLAASWLWFGYPLLRRRAHER